MKREGAGWVVRVRGARVWSSACVKRGFAVMVEGGERRRVAVSLALGETQTRRRPDLLILRGGATPLDCSDVVPMRQLFFLLFARATVHPFC